MKIYEASCVFVPVRRPDSYSENKLVQFFQRLNEEKTEFYISAHVFVYDHENEKDIINGVLTQHFMTEVQNIDFRGYKYLPTKVSYKEISLDDVRIVCIESSNQWIRYVRLLRYPDFDWDRYVLIEEPLALKNGTKLNLGNLTMFHNRDFSGINTEVNLDEVVYTFHGTDENGKQFQSQKNASKLRYDVLDPVFNSPEEELRFLKNEEKSV